jgi:protein-S-isoprenylcysteine O-methyltransferase Ste14
MEAKSDHAGVMVPPPLIYAAFFLAGIGLQRVIPLPSGNFGVVRLLGAVLIVVFLVLATWSVQRFRAAGTSVVPVRPTTALVVEGPYRLTRNPMYLGFLLLYIGLACWFGLWWPLILTPGLVWVIAAAVITREERYLHRKFGDDYRRYQTRVRRWL